MSEQEHVSVAEYTKAFEILFPDGGWFRVPKILHRIRPMRYDKKGNKVGRVPLKTAAYTLAAALNQSCAQRAVSSHDGWFSFCVAKTEEDTGFPSSTQYDHIILLEECQLVFRGRKSATGAGRILKINYGLLIKLLNKHDNHENQTTENRRCGSGLPDSGDQTTENRRSDRRNPVIPSSKKGGKKEETIPPASRGGVFPGKLPPLNGKLHSPPKQADPAPEEIEKVVNELRRVSSEVHRVAPTGKRASWVAHLLAIERKLLDNGRSRLLGVLRWYCENAGTDKCPKPIITGVCHLTIGVFTFIEGRMKDAGKKIRRPNDDCDEDYTRRHLEEYLESQRELEQAGRAYRAGRNGR